MTFSYLSFSLFRKLFTVQRHNFTGKLQFYCSKVFITFLHACHITELSVNVGELDSNKMFYDFEAREFETSVGKLIESPILHSSKVHLRLKIRTPVDLTQAAVIGTRPRLRNLAVSAAPVHQTAYKAISSSHRCTSWPPFTNTPPDFFPLNKKQLPPPTSPSADVPPFITIWDSSLCGP